MALVIMCVVLCVFVGVLGFLLKRATVRLLQFDEFFELLVDDIDINIRYLEKLLSSSLFSDSSEIKAAHRNMDVMRKRLDEFVLRAEELSGKRMRKLPKPAASKNPPVVV